MKKNISSVLICVLLIISAYVQNVSAAPIQTPQFFESRVLQADWGSKQGEIGSGKMELPKTVADKSINPIAADSKGNIYVGDSINHRVQKFDQKGRFLFDIDLRKYHEASFISSVIPDICVDRNDNIYIPFVKKEAVGKFDSTGRLLFTFHLKGIGVEDKNDDGSITLDRKVFFAINKLTVDVNGNIYIRGSSGNLLKFNDKGDLVRRWGPYVSHFFVDSAENLYAWLPPRQQGSMYKRFDKSGKQIDVGLGVFENIIVPSFADYVGNVYGIMSSDENQFGVVNTKQKKVVKLPRQSIVNLESEHWTIDQRGNIYYTDSQPGAKFNVYRIKVDLRNNEKSRN